MDLKQILDAVASLGALGFAIVGLWAFLTGKLHSDPSVVARLTDKDATIAYERSQKEAAYKSAERVQESYDTLAAAVKERNELDRERIRAGRS